MTMPRTRYQNNKPAPGAAERAKKKRGDARRSVTRALLAPNSTLNRRTHTDPESGTVFTSKKEMVAYQRNRRSQVLNHFAEMVRNHTLGQDPWEQLPGETDVQFTRFRAYLLQPRTPGKRRTVRAIIGTPGVMINMSTALDVCQRYHWVLRSECYDKFMREIEDEELRELRRQSIRRQAKLGAKLQDLAEKGAQVHLLSGALDVSPADVARLADTGVKIERLAFGDSTSNEAKQEEIRIVWDGPAPAWAATSDAVVEE